MTSYSKFENIRLRIMAIVRVKTFWRLGHVTRPGDLTFHVFGLKFSQKLQRRWGIRKAKRRRIFVILENLQGVFKRPRHES